MNYSRHYRRPTYFSWGKCQRHFLFEDHICIKLFMFYHWEYQKKRPKKSEKLMQINCLAGFFYINTSWKIDLFFIKDFRFFFMHHCTPTMQLLALSVYIGYKKNGGSFFFLWFITVFFIFLIFQFLNKGLSKKVYNRCRSWSLKE